MPIEIKELNIKVQVQDSMPQTNTGSTVSENQLNSIVAECVEQVLKIVNEKKER
ncbi:DUF5908 family protein [Chitinophaga sp. MM2321]|uniref:DUF5908 family protein n=1 Tax=Chitinophaga sp. MM2321 TaxID=3137178 RepID=UPI0032D59EFF